MTPGESIARCRWAARGYLMARMWYAGYLVGAVVAWYGVSHAAVYAAIRREHGRRR